MSNRRFPFSGSGSGERLKFYPNMKAIIAEKPSVGMDIARVVGATDKKDGYCTGNGYMVTWALGHLVSLAMPGAYGYTKTSAENLPMLPDPFRLVSRQVRTDKGMVTDIAAAKQLKIIDSVFDRCDSIIVATDCAREGELIFRWIYSYLGYTKPFKRLWISSLTDEAIREGLANLRDGSDYDSLYAAADCRAKADWLGGEPCPGGSLRLGEQLHRTCTDPDARHGLCPLQGEPEFRLHPLLAAAPHAETAGRAPHVHPHGRVQGKGCGRGGIPENHFRFCGDSHWVGTQEDFPTGPASVRPDHAPERLQRPL